MNYSEAEFKIMCLPDKIQLIIHKDIIVAESKEDNYIELFNYCLEKLGGRIAKKKRLNQDNYR